jgi:chemotaxis methyl-accepting protein methylase
LDGFDVSTAHFPLPQELAKNISFQELDSLKPVPDHLRGVYDIVHCRGLMLYVPNGDPSGLLDNQLAMLSEFQ